MTPRPRTTELELLPATFGPWEGEGGERDVATLMSGGVDSSVAALSLKEAGWNVLGITMLTPQGEAYSHPRPCCGADAAIVCRRLNVPHYFLDVRDAFAAAVIEPFRRAYREGRTPNPCVACNTALKFDVVWRFLERRFRVRRLATGHYARVVPRGGDWFLARAADAARDQSYFLYGVPRERLPWLLLPVGGETKREVRQRAAAAGLDTARKRDSMELCFAAEGDYRRALPAKEAGDPGPIRDTAGRRLGAHGGIGRYTVGQRRGLGIAGPEPLYVVEIVTEDNTLIVGSRSEAERRRVTARQINALVPAALRPRARLLGRIRSTEQPSPCVVVEHAEGAVTVLFDAPRFAPAPGQHLVLYDEAGDVVAGGVIVRETGTNTDGWERPGAARSHACAGEPSHVQR